MVNNWNVIDSLGDLLVSSSGQSFWLGLQILTKILAASASACTYVNASLATQIIEVHHHLYMLLWRLR